MTAVGLGSLSELDLDRVAYEAYGDAIGWKNHLGLPRPTVEDLPVPIRGAWVAAAQAARAA